MWAWDWAILNVEDKTDIRRGSKHSFEDRADAKHVWAGTLGPDLLVSSLYTRILDPRLPMTSPSIGTRQESCAQVRLRATATR